jgi:hypothetical protein
MLAKMQAKSGAVQRQLMQELELEQQDQWAGYFLVWLPQIPAEV